ncbi:nucleoside deaminase [Georgenia wangjunii]|uniref:nucleoside deaminase n=1 Tax=Georgenia wangjunii TaxID=3117730 RepID=UPI002F26AAA5
MDVSHLATSFRASLPPWVLTELMTEPDVLGLDDRMRVVNRLAARNAREGGGGPFAALVVDAETGNVLAVGVNQVLASNLSVTHAEVMALSLAQAALGRWDLGAAADQRRQLVVNWRPCAQCYGAVLWSGVSSLVIAGEGPEVEKLTSFDEGPVAADWADELRGRGIEVVVGVRREEALAVFREYGRAVAGGEVTVYNARGTGTGMGGTTGTGGG